MRLLTEADKHHPEDSLLRGEYTLRPPHIQVACPECGGSAKNIWYMSVFEEQNFHCLHCDWTGAVRLTGTRGKTLGK